MKMHAGATSLCLFSAGLDQIDGFTSGSIANRPSSIVHWYSDNEDMLDFQDRPLLKKFGQSIRKRIANSGMCYHTKNKVGAYTSKETIPRLDMQCSSTTSDVHIDSSIASRQEIRQAFSESKTSSNSALHGRSSGPGCVIIRLRGEDAVSMHKLVRYADRFFDEVDAYEENDVTAVGVFRIDKHVYAGFDEDVNGEGKMQFLDQRMYTELDQGGTTLLPIELESLMGNASMNDAHKGMNLLLDIGTQITSAVLGMNSKSAEKLIDDGSSNTISETDTACQDQVSNSYHRLIRYLKPQSNKDNAAFDAHVDSSFLTLIPLPEQPGLEIWCPSRSIDNDSIFDSKHNQGEWVRPELQKSERSSDNAYVVVMAGHFLELTSDGKVPTCIHRVIPPKPPPMHESGKNESSYRPRVSAPLFLRPRRDSDATLDLSNDLNFVLPESVQDNFCMEDGHADFGLYHRKGLLHECDEMHLWSAHDIMKLH